ncbi:MAG: tripartite tricarboxylate transporter TctB family protein [Deltaproteobacteria bacterium]|nr:tripartite tricarboxylate transporter TctB family protein [Deltaproteobacteria bacterium]
MKSDRISGIIIFAIGLAVCVASLSYPIGTLQKPGGGFFPLLASILLLGLSAVFILQSFTVKRGENASVVSFFPGNEASKRILCGFAALLGYRYLIPVIGFAPATAVFILFLGKFMERYSWKKSIFFSVATAISAYYLFQVVLKIAMPIPMLKL